MTTNARDLLEQAEVAQIVEDLSVPADEYQMQDISDPTRLVRVYKTDTGEPRDVPLWTLDGRNSILRHRLPDGSLAFSATPPFEWKLGEVPCLLAKSHPRRQEFRDIGLRAFDCEAEHLSSIYDQRQHMRFRHSREWETIQAHENEVRERENREFMRVQMRAAQMAVDSATSVKAPKQEKPDAFFCDVCGRGFKNAFGLRGHMKTHEKEG